MRQVLLYNPLAEHFTLPLGLLAVASALDRSRFEPKILDARLESDPHRALLESLDATTVCLGMSVLTGAPLGDAIAAASAVKAHFPALPIVWGGWHPSLFPEACLEEAPIDIVVRGQGEICFAELVERLAERRDPKGLAGCAWRDSEGRAVLGPPRPAEPVSTLPEVDYGLLDLERWFERKGRRQLDFVASQGCYWRCAFCADPRVYGRAWSGLEPRELARRVRRLHAAKGFDDLAFQDETFFTHPERAVDFAGLLIEGGPKISWTATMRADQGDRLTDLEFRRLARSGLRRLLIGVESGSRPTLERLQKDLRLEQVMLVAEKCRRHGIAVDFPFIVGLPEETESSVDASLAWAGRLRRMSPGFQTPIFFYRPYPGAALADTLAESGASIPRSLAEWARFDLQGAGDWVPPARVEAIGRRVFYLRQAWDAPPHRWKRPVRRLARWRMARECLRLPWEWWLARRLGKPRLLG